jgi:hypothetical protein
MDVATRFTRGDIVRASYSTQGLTAQRQYIVDEVVIEPTPFGGFTTYYLLDAKRTGKRFRVGNGHLVLSKVEPQQLTIRITDLVLFALSLDDVAMQQSLEVEVIYGKTLNDVVGGVEEIATVLHDIHSRGWNDSGWDQPKNWEYACRRAWKNVVKQMQAQGYDVRVAGPYKSVKLVRTEA